MNHNKRMRLADESFDAGLAALDAKAYQQAIDEFLKSAELYRPLFNAEDIYASCLLNIASAYSALGDPVRTKRFLEKALPIKKKVWTVNHPDVANIFNDLGRVIK